MAPENLQKKVVIIQRVSVESQQEDEFVSNIFLAYKHISHTGDGVLGCGNGLKDNDYFITTGKSSKDQIKIPSISESSCVHFRINKNSRSSDLHDSGSPPIQNIFTFPLTTTNLGSEEEGVTQRQHSSKQRFKTETFMVNSKSGNLQWDVPSQSTT